MAEESLPTLCMIFEALVPQSAIGKVAMADVRIALKAGFGVSVVAQQLDASLRDQVEWLKLYVPPRGFALKWLSARHFIRKALGNRRFDIIHAHQPQVANLSDVFQCHYLTRVALESSQMNRPSTLKARLGRIQERIVCRAEDRFYRRWNPQTRMLFNSELLCREFQRLYGEIPNGQILTCPCPPYMPATDFQRQEARRKLLGRDEPRVVVGYLGGIEERKGYRRLLTAMEKENDLILLMGGPFTESFRSRSLGDRLINVGLVRNADEFYAACDVVVMPSLFEPLGLVAFEAAARGIPVIATPEVGALSHLLHYDAGLAWEPDQAMGPLVKQAVSQRAALNAGAVRMVDALGEEAYGRRLLEVYQQVLGAKNRTLHA